MNSRMKRSSNDWFKSAPWKSTKWILRRRKNGPHRNKTLDLLECSRSLLMTIWASKTYWQCRPKAIVFNMTHCLNRLFPLRLGRFLEWCQDFLRKPQKRPRINLLGLLSCKRLSQENQASLHQWALTTNEASILIVGDLIRATTNLVLRRVQRSNKSKF